MATQVVKHQILFDDGSYYTTFLTQYLFYFIEIMYVFRKCNMQYELELMLDPEFVVFAILRTNARDNATWWYCMGRYKYFCKMMNDLRHCLPQK